MKNMKKILILLTLLCPVCLFAQTPRELIQQGNEAYGKSDFVGAANAYNAILDAGYVSADLYYNLGNAYYRQEEYGLAILNYERALRLKPNFRDARQNLQLANTKTEDEITQLPEIFIVQWARSLTSWFSPMGWRVVLLVLLAVLAALVVVIFLSQEYVWRKRSLIGSIFVVVLLLLALACAIASSVRANQHNQAIVTAPMIVVKSSPESGSVDKLILHEGTKVGIDETLGDWHKIHIADGNTGWVSTDEVTVI